MVDLSSRAHRIHVLIGLAVALLVFAILVLTPIYTEEPLTRLQSIQQRGQLNVLTLNAASTYYQGPNGADGFEYQLAKMFADFINVKLNIVVVDQYAELYTELLFDSGDLAAAGLSDQDLISTPVIDFGPTYFQAKQQLLYRKGNGNQPRRIDDLQNGTLEVILGTSHQRLLGQLQQRNPSLSWTTNREIGTEELIELVDEGLIDYIIADSHDIALQRRFFPELRIAFDIGESKQLRWAMKKSDDPSLSAALQEFFNTIKQDGRLDQLVHRYHSHVEKFSYSDIQTFSTHLRERLPRYQAFFQREATAQGLDWRLLAAIGYQESLWNPKAKSPTGVRGMMMLTLDTAKHVKIKDRLDVEQSIRGGAIYFNQVLSRLPDRIDHPDRTWMALAAYNVGYGHLEDARIITQNTGSDADKWIDVKKSLPLLGRKKWYKQTKHGYARGWEPVKYVENIRKYYDLLVWQDDRQNGDPDTLPNKPENDELLIPPSF